MKTDLVHIKECLPKELYGQLVDCNDIDGFIKKTIELVCDENKRRALDFSDWAKHHYDNKYLFQKILNKLEI